MMRILCSYQTYRKFILCKVLFVMVGRSAGSPYNMSSHISVGALFRGSALFRFSLYELSCSFECPKLHLWPSAFLIFLGDLKVK